MSTRPEIVAVDPLHPDPEVIARAAALIRAGQLVAMPTETVYGLAGDALSPTAIDRIYAAKGRPRFNPLIAHVTGIRQAREYAAEWPTMADALATRFWPGPLTLVLRRKANVPDALTAGLDTFGVRVPDHPVALALIEASQTPLAAPSANRFTEVSPVTAQQVARGLGDGVDMILDAGHTRVGIESTVVDVSGGRPVILRPGMISREQIEAVVGPAGRSSTPTRADAARPSPGMVAKHYAPRARVVMVPAERFDEALDESVARVGARAQVGAVTRSVASPAGLGLGVRLPDDADGYAVHLYDALHAADEAQCEELLVESPPAGAAWDAIRDRLLRAAHPSE